jgi:hypothetical protein
METEDYGQKAVDRRAWWKSLLPGGNAAMKGRYPTATLPQFTATIIAALEHE